METIGMIANTERPTWLLYPNWILLSCLSILVSVVLNLVVLQIITELVGDFIYVNGVSHITEDYLFVYTFFPVVGLVTGAVQFALLRRYLPHMGWWVFATTAGWLLAIPLFLMPNWLNWADGSPMLNLVFVLMGLAIGIPQWLLLRRRLRQASWWIAATVVGWGLWTLTVAGDSINQFGLLTLGLIPASATAAALAFLLKQVLPNQANGEGVIQ